MERQDDMQISTLSRLVESLGGRLELIAHMPKGDVWFTQVWLAGRLSKKLLGCLVYNFLK
jgi:hypothetical protein